MTSTVYSTSPVHEWHFMISIPKIFQLWKFRAYWNQHCIFSSLSSVWEYKNNQHTYAQGKPVLGGSSSALQSPSFCFYFCVFSFPCGTILMICLAKQFEIGAEKPTIITCNIKNWICHSSRHHICLEKCMLGIACSLILLLEFVSLMVSEGW